MSTPISNPTEHHAARRAAFRAEAAKLDRIDTAVYAEYGKDPLEPIIGGGPRDAPFAVFGRDPGRDEVRHGVPFIGAGGQKVRAELYRACTGEDLPDFEASRVVGERVFWGNTCPYKPLGNKAWSVKVKKAMWPLMASVLLEDWDGHKVITLGREAFFWFGLMSDRPTRQSLEAFWAREDRFESAFPFELVLGAQRKKLEIQPLPHPSPLNATWYGRFPGLLQARLKKMGWPGNRSV
ncbi:uracil-DNA glycosylase family protein [Acanthopleuribacter pedis]|uniref:Uracil-DNA glycosylase-like domain-containing protein n=1 Tax=Acanthopleuribacter pedis TaxID=442870 RepID=A0A8J7QC10_9BACT|nr:uracil-DNA glycosylase family protein [Acanthopleuribacter pedis]MBO1322861.1 hypothetical protein [Acanthopleuribacter pedis]